MTRADVDAKEFHTHCDDCGKANGLPADLSVACEIRCQCGAALTFDPEDLPGEVWELLRLPASEGLACRA